MTLLGTFTASHLHFHLHLNQSVMYHPVRELKTEFVIKSMSRQSLVGLLLTLRMSAVSQVDR